eukprot:scaffold8661_cov78-Skeletonema_dohrnii-CCMP3373.AAC.1
MKEVQRLKRALRLGWEWIEFGGATPTPQRGWRRLRLRWRCFWVDLACLWLVRFVSLLYFVSLLKRWSEGFDNRRWGSGYFEKQRNWMMWLPYLLRAENAFAFVVIPSSSHETAHALDPIYYTSRQWPQEAITRPYHTTMIFSKLCLPIVLKAQ